MILITTFAGIRNCNGNHISGTPNTVIAASVCHLNRTAAVGSIWGLAVHPEVTECADDSWIRVLVAAWASCTFLFIDGTFTNVTVSEVVSRGKEIKGCLFKAVKFYLRGTLGQGRADGCWCWSGSDQGCCGSKDNDEVVNKHVDWLDIWRGWECWWSLVA